MKHGKKQLRYFNLFLCNGRTLISISLGVIATQPFQMSLEVFWQKKKKVKLTVACRVLSVKKFNFGHPHLLSTIKFVSLHLFYCLLIGSSCHSQVLESK